MTVTVSGRTLTGTATAPASKSVLHRLLICAALSDKPTVLERCSLSQDIEATARCLRALGADIVFDEPRITVRPIRALRSEVLLDCGESGSTLRFLLPIAAALGGARFTGQGRLAERPLSPLYELLQENGCFLSPQGAFPLTVSGTLSGERFYIDGGVSSQFISGLLLAAPLLGRGCEIGVTGTVESRPYIDLTVAAMRRFGVDVTEKNNIFTVPQGSAYRSPERMAVEGDWSNGAFWMVAAAVADGDLAVGGLDASSLQGDRAIARLLCEAGVVVENHNDRFVTVGKPNKPLRVDASQIPDLVPILAVLAAATSGRTVIGNAGRLRLKESDRLCSVHAMLTALGGRVTMDDESLTVDGTGRLIGGAVDACNDHRVAMAAAVAACLCDEPVVINGAEAVRKSYPSFFKEFAERGMSVCPLYSGEN